MEYQFIGKVTHYFDRLSVAVVLLQDELYLDDWILIEGQRTELEQQVLSMQIDRKPIEKGAAGEEVAIKVEDVVHENDDVYLIVD
jgi:hypothetical protein